jgi:RimJ/RimL family protein N-acetyltransferase
MTQKVGELLLNWKTPSTPTNLKLRGQHVFIEEISDKDHSEQLYESYSADKNGEIWDYMAVGPFSNLVEFREWVKSIQGKKDPHFFIIGEVKSQNALGILSYMRIKPMEGCIEIGNISFSPKLQNTVAGTEAMYLAMNWAFENGYRRYEWKCNSLNKKSRKTAQRLGFSFEGLFRQATIVKGRNRDTAWFSVIDTEWKELKKYYEIYLNKNNFCTNGIQKVSLSTLTKAILKQKDPSV